MDTAPSPFSSSTPFPKPPLNPFPSFLLLLLLSSFPLLSLAAFVPADNYLLACGATAPVAAADGRLFLPDSSATPASLSASRSSPLSYTSSSSSLSPLLRSARLFLLPSSYSFPLSPSSSSTGLLLRLYFLPFPHPFFNLSSAQFSVSAAGSLILRRFSPTPSPLLKEFFLKPPSLLQILFPCFFPLSTCPLETIKQD